MGLRRALEERYREQTEELSRSLKRLNNAEAEVKTLEDDIRALRGGSLLPSTSAPLSRFSCPGQSCGGPIS